MARGELGEIRRLETDHSTYAVKQALGKPLLLPNVDAVLEALSSS